MVLRLVAMLVLGFLFIVEFLTCCFVAFTGMP